MLHNEDYLTGGALTHTRPLPERHEGAEDAVNQLRSVLDGEASLQLQSPVVVHHPAAAAQTQRRHEPSCLASVCIPAPENWLQEIQNQQMFIMNLRTCTAAAY